MKCKKGHTLSALPSNAGHYIGTLDPEDGGPFCRVSEEYFEDKQKAEEALTSGAFTFRNCMENNFCSGGRCLSGKGLAEYLGLKGA